MAGGTAGAIPRIERAAGGVGKSGSGVTVGRAACPGAKGAAVGGSAQVPVCIWQRYVASEHPAGGGTVRCEPQKTGRGQCRCGKVGGCPRMGRQAVAVAGCGAWGGGGGGAGGNGGAVGRALAVARSVVFQ